MKKPTDQDAMCRVLCSDRADGLDVVCMIRAAGTAFITGYL